MAKEVVTWSKVTGSLLLLFAALYAKTDASSVSQTGAMVSGLEFEIVDQYFFYVLKYINRQKKNRLDEENHFLSALHRKLALSVSFCVR